jgi:outer membrane lipoprotein-sorting protein
VTKIAFGVAAAVVFGLASFSALASAAAPVQEVAAPITDVSAARYVVRKTVIRRGGPVCSVRKIVRRGPMGRRVVTTTRVCS